MRLHLHESVFSLTESSAVGASCHLFTKTTSEDHASFPACSGGAVCVSGFCVCPPRMIAVNGNCASEHEQLLTACAHDTDCPSPLACSNGECHLPSLQFRHLTRRSTAKYSPKSSMICWPGSESCADDRGICINNICHCMHGYIEKAGECREDVVPLGTYCEIRSPGPRCAEDAICLNGICRCKVPGGCTEETRRKNKKRRRFPEENCDERHDQCENGAVCRDGVCRCPEGSQLMVRFNYLLFLMFF